VAPSIEPTPDQFRALSADAELPGSILMLNMLRFREQAAYPDDFEAEPCSGEQAYGRYAAASQPFLEKVGGAPIWAGPARTEVIAPADETWDVCFLVRYPSRKAFLAMATDAGYLAVVPHRSAALADSRLILCEDVADVPTAFGLTAPD
jgi:uncharacterized protein (DUF1330 family)